MNPFEMVIGIVLIVTIGSVVRAKYGVRRDNKGNEFFAAPADKCRDQGAANPKSARSRTASRCSNASPPTTTAL